MQKKELLKRILKALEYFDEETITKDENGLVFKLAEIGLEELCKIIAKEEEENKGGIKCKKIHFSGNGKTRSKWRE